MTDHDTDPPLTEPEGRMLIARWGGHCQACELPIYPGEAILVKADRPAIHYLCRP